MIFRKFTTDLRRRRRGCHPLVVYISILRVAFFVNINQDQTARELQDAVVLHEKEYICKSVYASVCCTPINKRRQKYIYKKKKLNKGS